MPIKIMTDTSFYTVHFLLCKYIEVARFYIIFCCCIQASLNKIKQNSIKTGHHSFKTYQNWERQNGTWYWCHSVFCFFMLYKQQNGIQIVNHSVNNQQNGTYIMYHSVFKLTEWHPFCLSLQPPFNVFS